MISIKLCLAVVPMKMHTTFSDLDFILTGCKTPHYLLDFILVVLLDKVFSDYL